MNKLVIALVGPPGAGKTELAKHLTRRHAAKHISLSDILKAILVRLHIPLRRRYFSWCYKTLEFFFGEAVLAKKFLKMAPKEMAPILVIDGFRRLADDEHMRKHCATYVLVSIEASEDIRFARVRNRGEKVEESGLSLEEFRRMHTLGAEIQVPELTRRAHHAFINESTLPEMYTQIDHLLAQIATR